MRRCRKCHEQLSPDSYLCRLCGQDQNLPVRSELGLIKTAGSGLLLLLVCGGFASLLAGRGCSFPAPNPRQQAKAPNQAPGASEGQQQSKKQRGEQPDQDKQKGGAATGQDNGKQAAGQGNLSGRWKGTITQRGTTWTGVLALDLVQSGNTITGTSEIRIQPVGGPHATKDLKGRVEGGGDVHVHGEPLSRERLLAPGTVGLAQGRSEARRHRGGARPQGLVGVYPGRRYRGDRSTQGMSAADGRRLRGRVSDASQKREEFSCRRWSENL
jgi:hypothetical protein